MTPLVGVLVGGASRRMGGRAKGLLPAPGSEEPILLRLLRLGREAGLDVVTVGDDAPYAALRLNVPNLVDEPRGVGPIGGLAALLRHAGSGLAIALSCDLPYFSPRAAELLVSQASRADVIAGRRTPDGVWEPFVARYSPERVLPVVSANLAQGRHSLQEALAQMTVEELALIGAERSALVDWDSPYDVESKSQLVPG